MLRIQDLLVTAEQMQQIEGHIFAAGMPVAALMEKVSHRIVRWFTTHYGQLSTVQNRLIGVIVGPGHNGGDALVVARELHHAGYQVRIYQPLEKAKPLTAQHAQYAKSIGIEFVSTPSALSDCGLLIDGLFGFGLDRPITGSLADDVDAINRLPMPVYSIDLPSGLHTDTGQVMGIALRATRTACLGLWKRAFVKAEALPYLGISELIEFDIPLKNAVAVLGKQPAVQQLNSRQAIAQLPLNRAATAHKYTAGHLLLVAGSRQYAGAALLAGLGATASGVGMLTIAIPESIRLALLPQLPGALLVGCPETPDGAIAHLPASLDLSKYDAIALGPGLTPTVSSLLDTALAVSTPLLLDADALNLLAETSPIQRLQNRSATTVLTPHTGEFKRLFPSIYERHSDRLPGEMAQQAAQASNAIVLLKGPCSAIATDQRLWFNPHSTPALARGGSGDVLTGLMGGLLASAARESNHLKEHLADTVASAVWWHSQAGRFASSRRSLLGVDPTTLAQSLNPALKLAIDQLNNSHKENLEE